MNELLQLMHDTMNKTATIKSSVTLLKSGSLSKEDESKILDIIEIRAKELDAVLDAYYNKNTK